MSWTRVDQVELDRLRAAIESEPDEATRELLYTRIDALKERRKQSGPIGEMYEAIDRLQKEGRRLTSRNRRIDIAAESLPPVKPR